MKLTYVNFFSTHPHHSSSLKSPKRCIASINAGNSLTYAVMDIPYIPHRYNTQELEKIPFLTHDGYEFLIIAEINHAKADGNYTTIHMLDKRKILVILPMCNVLKILPRKTFFCVHDSFFVNGNQCQRIDKTEMKLYLEDGTVLSIAKRRFSKFVAFFLKVRQRRAA